MECYHTGHIHKTFYISTLRELEISATYRLAQLMASLTEESQRLWLNMGQGLGEAQRPGCDPPDSQAEFIPKERRRL